jgi:hypothetical protein
VREVRTPPPLTGESTVAALWSRDIAQLMADHDTHLLVVASTGSSRPVGVLSTLDIARAIGGCAACGGRLILLEHAGDRGSAALEDVDRCQ